MECKNGVHLENLGQICRLRNTIAGARLSVQKEHQRIRD